jgi:hypothetical protein
MATNGSQLAIAGLNGRVKHDERGSAVFDWAVTTGVLRLTSKDKLIDALTVPDLKILPLCVGLEYDPYNHGAR